MVDINKAKFWRGNEYLHCFIIEGLHEWLKPFKQEIIKDYNEWVIKGNNEGIANFSISNQNLNVELSNLFFDLLNKWYTVDPPFKPLTAIGAYYQDNKSGISNFHNHYKVSDINFTTYIDPPNPNEGGELQVYFHEENQDKINIEKDTIYCFPGWLMHRPLPQTSLTPRICFNWGYRSYSPIFNKASGDRW